jgi:hypothetical protein
MKCIIELDFVAPCMTWKQKLFTKNIHSAYMPKLSLVVDGYWWVVKSIGGLGGLPASGKVLHRWLLLCDYRFGNASTSKLNMRSEVVLTDLGSGELWGSTCYLPSHAPSGIRYRTITVPESGSDQRGTLWSLQCRRGWRGPRIQGCRLDHLQPVSGVCENFFSWSLIDFFFIAMHCTYLNRAILCIVLAKTTGLCRSRAKCGRNLFYSFSSRIQCSAAAPTLLPGVISQQRQPPSMNSERSLWGFFFFVLSWLLCSDYSVFAWASLSRVAL